MSLYILHCWEGRSRADGVAAPPDVTPGEGVTGEGSWLCPIPRVPTEGNLGLDDFCLEVMFLQHDTTLFHFYILFVLFVYTTCCVKEKTFKRCLFLICLTRLTFLVFFFNYIIVHVMSLWGK